MLVTVFFLSTVLHLFSRLLNVIAKYGIFLTANGNQTNAKHKSKIKYLRAKVIRLTSEEFRGKASFYDITNFEHC